MPGQAQFEAPLTLNEELERETASGLELDSQENISLLDLVIVVARGRWLIAKMVLIGGLAGLLIALLIANRYTAYTSLLPPQQNSSGSAALMAQLGSLGSVASLAGSSLGLKNPNDLQVGLLRSRTVEDAMIDRFHLMDLYRVKSRTIARVLLEKAVDIDNGSKDGLIRIFVTDRSPERAADMANAYVEEYRRTTSTLAITEAAQRRLFFEQQLAEAKDNLAKAEESLKATEQQAGLIQIDAQARAVIQSVAQLRGQIAAKEVEIRAMRSFATDENPSLQTAEQELAGLRAEEVKLGASPDGSSNMLPIPKGNMQATSLEYVRKLRDVKYFETIFDLLARQYEAAKMDEARQGAVVQVVDRAVVPELKSSPKRTLIVLGLAILGAFLAVLWIFIAEGFARLRKNPAEHERLAVLRTTLLPSARQRDQS